MVAHQILVLSVQVRVLVEQQIVVKIGVIAQVVSSRQSEKLKIVVQLHVAPREKAFSLFVCFSLKLPTYSGKDKTKNIQWRVARTVMEQT